MSKDYLDKWEERAKLNTKIIEQQQTKTKKMTYIIQNDYIGFLNGGESYPSYIIAMRHLLDWFSNDYLSEESVCKEFPKSKWEIYDESGKSVFSISTKKFLS